MKQWKEIAAATRASAAALTALAAAELLGLACPYWAAMTALIVIQPTRGQLLEKSLYRLVGTVVGSSAAMLLLLHTRDPMIITSALSLWIAGCVGIGNLLYGFRSYAALIAGCTCAVITVSGYQDPPHLHHLAFGRIACIIVGIAVATAVTAIFTPRQGRDGLMMRVDRVVADSISWLALLLRKGAPHNLAHLEREILVEIAKIEGLLDAAGAGSAALKRRMRHVRSLIASILSLIGVGRLAGAQLARHYDLDRRHGYWRTLLAKRLETMGTKGNPLSAQHLLEMSAIVAEARNHLPILGGTLADIVSSLREVSEDFENLSARPEAPPLRQSARHRDWREARRAALRAGLVIAGIGIAWSLSGWKAAPLMLMAASIMITIFSTKDHPPFLIGQIFVGAATGAALAVFCRVALLPSVSDPFVTLAAIAPFVLAGTYAMTQRRTAIMATDATLFFIFGVQPGVIVTATPGFLAVAAVAMVGGVGMAWLAYRYLVPVTPALRVSSLLDVMVQDLEILRDRDFPVKAAKWQARMQHRVLRLVALAANNRCDVRRAVQGGLSAVAIAASAQRLPQETAADIRERVVSACHSGGRSADPAQLMEQAAHSLFEALLPAFGPEAGLTETPATAVRWGVCGSECTT